MHFKDLNMIQKGRMKQICDNKYTMEWVNPEFMDFLMGELPRIRKSKDDKYIANELEKLERVLCIFRSNGKLIPLETG